MSAPSALIWTRSLETWDQDQDILAIELPKNVELIHWPSQQLSASNAESLTPEDLQRNDEQILVTSQNSLRFLHKSDLETMRTRTFHTFGSQTAQALAQAGMTQVICHGDAQDGAQFAKILVKNLNPNIPLVWWRGADVAFELAMSLKAAGFKVREVKTYVQQWGPYLDDGQTRLRAQDIESHLFLYQDRVLFSFASPKAARTFEPLIKAANLDKSALNAVVIGPGTAKALDPAMWNRIQLSQESAVSSLVQSAVEQLSANLKPKLPESSNHEKT